MLLHEQHAEAVIEKAVKRLCEKLPFGLTLDVSVVGVPSLYNESPTHSELASFIRILNNRDLSELFKIKTSLVPEVMVPLDSLLAVHGIAPRWPKSMPGALVSLYSTLEGMDDAIKEVLCEAAHLALLFNLKVDGGSKSGIPDYNERERAVLNLLPEAPPEWLAKYRSQKARYPGSVETHPYGSLDNGASPGKTASCGRLSGAMVGF